MGMGRVELPTSRLSGVRSNHLSYRPYRANQYNQRGRCRQFAAGRIHARRMGLRAQAWTNTEPRSAMDRTPGLGKKSNRV